MDQKRWLKKGKNEKRIRYRVEGEEKHGRENEEIKSGAAGEK